MKPKITLLVALAGAVSFMAIASQASAQDAAREAAIAKCVKLVQDSRGSGPDQEAQRVSAFKACMTAAGQKP
jgi:hypothetical protein